ncbi:MAG: BTAD domain-containing putative transcriptional regulator [bacterium]
MSTRISLLKITPPTAREVLPRKRLFHLMDRGLKRPLVWVIGPAGSGKTTLIATYLDNRKLPCLWYQLDQADNEIATFFYYMGLAAKKAGFRRRKPLPCLTSEYILDIPTFTRRYFEDLYDRLQSSSVIVFDNYQMISPHSMLHEILREGLSRIPEGITVIFAGREEPPPAMIRLLANSYMEIIEWKDLRFTEDETQELAKIRSQGGLSLEMMQQIHYVAQGWAAGLILILLRVRREGFENQLPDRYLSREIFDYFSTQILMKMEPSIKNFLLMTAHLPHMTPHMAVQLTGNEQAECMLLELHAKNCFLEKRQCSEKEVYQYHDLFRDFLISRAKETFSPSEILQLLYSAACILEDVGHIEEAAELYLRTESWEEMAQLIVRHAKFILQQGRNHTLQGWIAGIPDERIQHEPWLLYWMGISLLPSDPAEARGYLEEAYVQFKRENDPSGLFLSWSFIVNSFIHERSNLYRLEPWIMEFQQMCVRYPRFPSVEIEAQATFSMFVALVFYVPSHPVDPPLSEWAKKTETLVYHIPDSNQQIIMSLFLDLYYCYAGKLSKAALISERIKEEMDYLKISPLTSIIAKVVEAHYACYTGDFARSLKSVEKGLQTAENFGVHIYTPHIYAFGAYSALASLDLASATTYLKKMASCIENSKGNSYTAEYHYLAAWKAWLRGELALAVEHSRRALAISNESQDAPGLMSGHVAIAHLLTECGKKREAGFHLAKVKEMIHQSGYEWIRYKWLLAGAQLAFKGAKKEEGLRYMKQAMIVGREKGIMFTDFFHPSVMTGLCVKALEAGIEVQHVQKLICRLKLDPEESSLDCEQWPFPLKIVTLGIFSVLKNQKSLHFSFKVQKKPLELLKLLISYGDREVKEIQLSDTLWPDADGDMAHRSFATALHRLRKLLGNEKAVHLEGGIVSLNPRFCWVDIRAFEHFLHKADQAFENTDRSTAVHWMEKAFALYHGPFLPADEAATWSAPCREHLRNIFLRSIEKLSPHLEEEDRYDRAVDWLKKGLEVDDLAEGLYQKLMLLLKHLNRRAEALEVYHRCRKILDARLGIEPSPKTETIYKSLTSA